MSLAPESCDDCVSWESAFWALVPFLLSLMAQPCGQVCTFAPRLRTYMRCSPVVCAADTIGMIIHLTLLIYSGSGPRKAAHTIIEARQAPQAEASVSGQGLQSLENSLAFRALVFCIGTLPQVVKLMALSGIPWTKVWAGLYFGSFITTEILLFMAEGQDEDTETSTTRDNSVLLKHMPTIKTVLGQCSVRIHLILMAWACYQILVSNVECSSSSWPFSTLFAIFFFSSFLVTIPFQYERSGPFTLERRTSLFSPYIICLILCSSYLLIVIAIPGIVHRCLREHFKYLLWSLIFDGICISMLFLSSFSKHVQNHVFFLGRPLVVGSSENVFKIWMHDTFSSFHAWAYFVGTIALSVSWYSTCYDATGTYKPEWVNRLG